MTVRPKDNGKSLHIKFNDESRKCWQQAFSPLAFVFKCNLYEGHYCKTLCIPRRPFSASKPEKKGCSDV